MDGYAIVVVKILKRGKCAKHLMLVRVYGNKTVKSSSKNTV